MFHDAPMEAVETATVAVHRRPRVGRSDGTSLADRLASEYQIEKVIDFILTFRHKEPSEDGDASSEEGKPMLKVALQFPDNMLDDVTNLVHELETRLHADARYPAYQAALKRHRELVERKKQQQAAAAASANTAAARLAAARAARGGALSSAASPAASTMANPNAPTDDTRFFVLADNTFGSCCPDEITALHYDSDCIVHFGEACMSKATRLPVLYIHPVMKFGAIEPTTAGHATPSQGGDKAVLRGEVSLLLETVSRVRSSIERRRNHWNTCHTADKMIVSPRLVVVGTPSSAHLFAAVEKLLIAEQDAAEVTVPVEWCRFPPSEDGTHTSGSPSSAHSIAVNATELTNDNEQMAGWVVNGARFSRLTEFKQRDASTSSVVTPMQHFLFVGPSSASHPIHLHSIHQYNCFHYPPTARSYLEDDNTADDCDAAGRSIYAPMLFVVDEHFAVLEKTSEGGTCEGSADVKPTRLAADASRSDACTFLDTVFYSTSDADAKADGKTAVAAEGSAAQSTRALTTIHRRLNQRSFNIEAVRASSAVGILVASLAIEGYYECTMLLHQLLRAYGKRSYILYVGHLNEFKLANFADTVDCFVVVACPNARHCHFPEKSDNYMKRVVSPAEVLLALTADPGDVDCSYSDTEEEEEGDRQGSSGRARKLYGMPGLYNTEFMCILEPLREALAQRKRAVEEAVDTDANGGDARTQEQWRESAALIRMTSVGGGVLTATQSTAQGALARLHEREYVGLNPHIGQTAVQGEIVQGKHGIARGYAKEREAQDKPE